jgi:hypothetical protein
MIAEMEVRPSERPLLGIQCYPWRAPVHLVMRARLPTCSRGIAGRPTHGRRDAVSDANLSGFAKKTTGHRSLQQKEIF